MMRFALDERRMLELVALVRPAMSPAAADSPADAGGGAAGREPDGIDAVAAEFARIAWGVLA